VNKILRLYFSVLFLGTLTNIILIVAALKTLGYGYKSEISVYIYSIPGYFIKSIIFSLILFLLFKNSVFENRLKRNITLWIPFLLFLFWFGAIMIFKIDSLHTELSYGYTYRFPHFLVQLLSSLIITISSIYQLGKISKNSESKSPINHKPKLGMFKIIIPSILLIIIGYNSFFFFKKRNLESFCDKNSTFESSSWKKDKKVRYCMLDNIISEKLLINKTKDELVSILGKPFTSNDYFGKNSLQFRTSQKSGQYLHWYLHVELENEIVIHVQKSLD
jgi:hypothetical protein